MERQWEQFAVRAYVCVCVRNDLCRHEHSSAGRQTDNLTLWHNIVTQQMEVTESLQLCIYFLRQQMFSYLQRSCHIHWLMATFKDNSHISCRAPAVPLPCRVPKGLRRVFPIRITQSDRVWFTQAGPCPYHAPTMPRCDFSRPRHSTAEARHGHDMVCMN